MRTNDSRPVTGQRVRRLARALVGATALALCAVAAPVSSRPAAPPSAPAPQAPARPNIVVILVDDMGFSDIASYGSEIPTPNLDALAAGGLRFTQFYNCARCSPSRASLMTGLYPHEAGMGHLDNLVEPQSHGTFGRLLDRAVTVPEVLHDAGYFSGMAGKWNLGTVHGSGPATRGFDRSFESPGGLYFPGQPKKPPVRIDGRPVPSTSSEVGKGNWYMSDLLVDWETKFVGEAKEQHKPFFLYLPFTAPHFPVMAPPEDIARFKGKYMAGWEAMRRARLVREKELGIIAKDQKLSPPLPEAYDWNRVPAEDKDRFDTMMAVYAAAISRMDKAVGELVGRLKASGELDNTLILFMSDNGGNAEGGPDGQAEGGPLGSATSQIKVGLNWATLQNGPFQYFKHYTEEGGISTPLIAYWPKGIDPKLRGGFVREPGHLVDIMPTLVDVAGAQYPKTFKGNDILPEEGRSFSPAFHGQTLTRSVPLFWSHEGNRAVRDGQWKLVARWGEPWQLFDMNADRTETSDLSGAHGDIVKRMAAQWDAWAARSFVDPWPKRTPGGVVKGSLEGGHHGGGRRQNAAGPAEED